MKKRLICMLTVLALFVGLIPSVTAADKPAFSGACGDSIQWVLEPESGVLTISGSGVIPDFSYGEGAPWYACRARIFSAVLDDGISGIGDYAFNECFALTTVDAGTLHTIGQCAFSNCIALEGFSFTPDKILTVGEEAFNGCTALTELELAADQGSIGAGAFADCTALAKLTLPKSLARLEDDCFRGCTALAAFALPEDLTYIGKSCFYCCLGLTELTVPASVTRIDRYAFQGCGNLSLSFAGNAPEFADADDLACSFISASVLKAPYDAEGWTWPICKGYGVEYIFPSLDGVFTDLLKGYWYIPSVQHVYYRGLMNGMTEDTFAPQRAMTRAQLVTVLYRIAGQPEVDNTIPFTDVVPAAYYYDAVRWAHQNGIVTGLSDSTFGPNEKLIREQLCTILYRYANTLELDLNSRDTLQDFIDEKQLAGYARDPMGWCVAMGFINGKPGGKLDPKGSATRAEIAKVLASFDTYLASTELSKQNDWLKEFDAPDPGPDIDREDPLYLYAREIFSDLNVVRNDAGLNSLQWDDYVYLAAKTRAEELSTENGFGHTRPNGTSYSTIFTDCGISCNIRNEVIAHGYTSADALVQVWSTASSTSPVIHAKVYSTAAVGVFQLPPAADGEEGKYFYALLVIG